MTSSKPSCYIKGWVEFYKLKFKVTPDTLIPRPETELLVDEVLNFVKDSHVATRKSFRLSPPQNDNNVIASEAWQSYTIIDLGTGAGNIAISLACNLEGCNVKIVATDISQKALKVARQNAKFHSVSDKIKFIHSNLLEKVSESPDIIVTNLPYIHSARIPYLDSSVKDFEPHIALDGGEDGFELYRKLFRQIYWKPKLIIGEIDYTHGELAINEAYKYFPKAEIEVKKDLAYLQRILLIRHFP